MWYGSDFIMARPGLLVIPGPAKFMYLQRNANSDDSKVYQGELMAELDKRLLVL
jgi:hypothetical protein